MLLLLAVTSCDSYLDKVPPHSLVENNAIVDAASAEAALIGTFYPLKGMNPSPFGANYISDGSHMLGFTTGRFRSFDDQLEVNSFNKGDAWDECSDIINSANFVIEKTEQVDDSKFPTNRKQEIIAEAKFLRFFAQYYLMRHYSQFWDLNSSYGALMRREPSRVSNNDKMRETVADTYTLLLEDLDYVIANGPEFVNVYRPSKLLAKAYKAEVLLMRSTNDDLQNAITIANEVLADNKRSKETAYADIFANAYSSSELLFTRYMDAEMLDGVFSNVGSIVRMFGGTYEPTIYFMEILGDDARTSFYNESVVDGENKFVRVPKLYKEDGNCLPYYMRTSEMELIKAEAYVVLNNKQKALDAVNTLRLRAGEDVLLAADVTDANLSTVIFNEIVKEMALENGYEWFAAIRLKDMSGKRLIYTLKIEVESDEQLIWPIPQKEEELNGLMIQNPGYEHLF